MHDLIYNWWLQFAIEIHYKYTRCAGNPGQVMSRVADSRVVAFLYERMNERPRVARKGGKVDGQMSGGKYRGSRRTRGSTKTRSSARPCTGCQEEGDAVVHVSFPSIRGSFREAKSLHGKRQFARHASICQCQRRWPRTELHLSDFPFHRS